MSGKGDKRRPQLVSRKVFEDNWNKVFGKKKRKRKKGNKKII